MPWNKNVLFPTECWVSNIWPNAPLFVLTSASLDHDDADVIRATYASFLPQQNQSLLANLLLGAVIHYYPDVTTHDHVTLYDIWQTLFLSRVKWGRPVNSEIIARVKLQLNVKWCIRKDIRTLHIMFTGHSAKWEHTPLILY